MSGQQAFDTLKDMLTSSPVLTYPDLTNLKERPFILEIDASSHGLGVVLLQKSAEDNREHVLEYRGRAISKREAAFVLPA